MAEGPKHPASNSSGNAPTPEVVLPSKLVSNLKGETSDKKRGKSLSLTKQPSSKVEKKGIERVPFKVDSKASLLAEKTKGAPLSPQPSNSKTEVNFPLGTAMPLCRR
jgi:hypothetical protein